jgi:hypothetical protein
MKGNPEINKNARYLNILKFIYDATFKHVANLLMNTPSNTQKAYNYLQCISPNEGVCTIPCLQVKLKTSLFITLQNRKLFADIIVHSVIKYVVSISCITLLYKHLKIHKYKVLSFIRKS